MIKPGTLLHVALLGLGCTSATPPKTQVEAIDSGTLRAWGEDASGASDVERMARAQANAISGLAEQLQVQVRTTTVIESERVTRRVGEQRVAARQVTLRRATDLRSDLVLSDARVVMRRCSAGACRALVELDLARARTRAAQRLMATEQELASALDRADEGARNGSWRTVLRDQGAARSLLSQAEGQARELEQLGGPTWSSLAIRARFEGLRARLREVFALCVVSSRGNATLAQRVGLMLERRELPFARILGTCALTLELEQTSEAPAHEEGLVLQRVRLRALLVEHGAAPIALEVTGRGMAETVAQAEQRALEDAADRLAERLATELVPAQSELAPRPVSF